MRRVLLLALAVLSAAWRPALSDPTCPAGELGIRGSLAVPNPDDWSWVDCVFFDGSAELYPDGYETLYFTGGGTFDYGCHPIADTAWVPAGATDVLCHTPDLTAPDGDRALTFPVADGYIVVDFVVGEVPTTTSTTATTSTTPSTSTTTTETSTTSTTVVATTVPTTTTTTTTTTTIPCTQDCDDGDPCTADGCDPIANACTHVPLTGAALAVCPCDRTPPASCDGAFLPAAVSKPEFVACRTLRSLASNPTPRRVHRLGRVVRRRVKAASHAATVAGRKGTLSNDCAAAVEDWLRTIGGGPQILTGSP